MFITEERMMMRVGVLVRDRVCNLFSFSHSTITFVIISLVFALLLMYPSLQNSKCLLAHGQTGQHVQMRCNPSR